MCLDGLMEVLDVLLQTMLSHLSTGAQEWVNLYLAIMDHLICDYYSQGNSEELVVSAAHYGPLVAAGNGCTE
ncbi:unnamed protein product [Urochloa humidicola]